MNDIQKKALWSTPLLLIAVLSTILLAGCAGAAPAAKSVAQATELSGRTVTVRGELTDDGVGCKAVRAADGTMYNLARDIEGTEKGERIWVEGYVVPNEKC